MLRWFLPWQVLSTTSFFPLKLSRGHGAGSWSSVLHCFTQDQKSPSTFPRTELLLLLC